MIRQINGASGGEGDGSVRTVFDRVDKPLLGLLLLLAACASPDRSPEPPVGETDVRLFTGARLIVGNGTVIENGALVVQDDVITDVGEADEVRVIDGATVVDLTGQTVITATSFGN